MLRFASLLVSAALTSGCVSTHSFPNDGPAFLYDGQGGSMTTLDGIEVWETGEPNGRHRLVGVVVDHHRSVAVTDEVIRRDLLRHAREYGADAVVNVTTSQSPLAGKARQLAKVSADPTGRVSVVLHDLPEQTRAEMPQAVYALVVFVER